MVVSGPDAGAGHPGGLLGPSQGWIPPPSRSGCGVGSVARDGGAPGPARNSFPAALSAPESRLAAFSVLETTAGGNGGLKMALRAFDSGSGDREG